MHTRFIRYMIFLLLFLAARPLSANHTADSLRRLLKDAEKVEKVLIYNQLSECYRYKDQALARRYADTSVTIARQSDNAGMIAASLSNLGEFYLAKGEHTEALNVFSEALKLRETLGDQSAIARSLAGIGAVYYFSDKYNMALLYQMKALNIYHAIGIENRDGAAALNLISYIYEKKGFYEKTIEYRFRALKIRRKLGDPNEITKSLNSIGDFYLQQGNLVKALEHYGEAYSTSKKIDHKKGISIALNNLAVAHFRQGDHPKAIEMLRTAVALKRELNHKKELAISLHHLGLMYHTLRDYNKALGFLHEALQIREVLKERSQVTFTLTALARVYASMLQYNRAIHYHQRAIDIASSLEQPMLLMESYEGIANTYLYMNDSPNFLNYYKQFLHLKDSVADKLTSARIIQMQQRFETEKTTSEIARLKQEKLIQEIELKRKTSIQQMLIVFVILSVTIAALIYMFYGLKKKSNKRLEEQNNIIRRKNREFEVMNEELQQVNEKLILSESKLRQLNDSKDKFFSIISHDLRGPIATLSAFLALLASNAHLIGKEEFKELIEEVQGSVRNVAGLLNNLLKWSHTQMGRDAFDPVPVSLHKVVTQTLSLLSLNARSKNIVLESTINEQIVVQADINMLEFIVRNLVSNAIKFTFNGGQIKVMANLQTGKVTLSVADTGVGISEERREKLFETQHRVTTLGTDREPGTGLGLILCREFAEKHKGYIYTEANEPQGTVFHVVLPLQVTEPSESVAQSEQLIL